MALIKWSGLISEFKGKLNGSIFSNPTYGAQVRNRKSCKGKESTIWGIRKSILGQIASQWKGLTVLEQGTFISRTALYPYVNKFGDSVAPSGYQLYCTLNLNRNLIGQAELTTCLDPAVEISFGTFDLIVGAIGELEFNYTSPSNADVIACFYVTAPQQRSIYSIPPAMAFIAIQSGSSASPFNIDGPLADKYGAVVDDQKYFWRVEIIDSTTGQRYGQQNGSMIVSGHA